VLVLSRRPEQSLILGDEITITVLGVDGDRVRLGIEAPRRISVLRQEIYLQVKNANASAAAAARPTIQSIAAALRDPKPSTDPAAMRDAESSTDPAAAIGAPIP
jgi:carbon storage regulator